VTHHSSQASSIDLSPVSFHELCEHTRDVFNLIAQRAFKTFENRGCVHGNNRQVWLLAESEPLTPVTFHISESAERITARAQVPEFNRQEIKVSLEPRRLSISAKSDSCEDHPSTKHNQPPGRGQIIFKVIDLPAEVDLSKVKATLNDGTLKIMMPKAAPAEGIHVETGLGLPVEDSSTRKNDGIEGAGARRLSGMPPNQPPTRNRHRRGNSVGRIEKQRFKNVMNNAS
jgi:HSP20 family molecular chaperone IbpA